jgi:hypothetical protein
VVCISLVDVHLEPEYLILLKVITWEFTKIQTIFFIGGLWYGNFHWCIYVGDYSGAM